MRQSGVGGEGGGKVVVITGASAGVGRAVAQAFAEQGASIGLLARGRDAVRWTALATTLATFLVSLVLFGMFDWNKAGDYAWLSGARDGSTFAASLVQP